MAIGIQWQEFNFKCFVTPVITTVPENQPTAGSE